MIYYPCRIDGTLYANTRIAYREVFLPEGVSYDRIQRALKKGAGEFLGHKIERVYSHYAIDRPPEPESDCADLRRLPAETAPEKQHKRGEPLLFFPPGEKPIERGIRHYH